MGRIPRSAREQRDIIESVGVWRGLLLSGKGGGGVFRGGGGKWRNKRCRDPINNRLRSFLFPLNIVKMDALPDIALEKREDCGPSGISITFCIWKTARAWKYEESTALRPSLLYGLCGRKWHRLVITRDYTQQPSYLFGEIRRVRQWVLCWLVETKLRKRAARSTAASALSSTAGVSTTSRGDYSWLNSPCGISSLVEAESGIDTGAIPEYKQIPIDPIQAGTRSRWEASEMGMWGFGNNGADCFSTKWHTSCVLICGVVYFGVWDLGRRHTLSNSRETDASAIKWLLDATNLLRISKPQTIARGQLLELPLVMTQIVHLRRKLSYNDALDCVHHQLDSHPTSAGLGKLRPQNRMDWGW
jgi:hypothetical protein